jgi:hypothetical protein
MSPTSYQTAPPRIHFDFYARLAADGEYRQHYRGCQETLLKKLVFGLRGQDVQDFFAFSTHIVLLASELF